MSTGFGYHAMGSARVAELVDARDLKSLGGFHRAGSIPALGTNNFNHLENPRKQPFSPFWADCNQTVTVRSVFR
jgi:hypothetical protein